MFSPQSYDYYLERASFSPFFYSRQYPCLSLHQSGHDHVADEEALAGEDEVVAFVTQESVGEEGLGLVQTVTALG